MSQDSMPLYLRIKQDIKQAIENGELVEGDRIPSEMELAEQYGVSRNPTRQALRELDLEGFITRTRRRGSFVAPATQRMRPVNASHGRVIAIICPDVRSPHVRTIVNGFIHEAGTSGYHGMVYFMDCTDRAQSDLLVDIRSAGLAGVALWLTDNFDQTIETLDRFHKARFPFILLDRFVPGREWNHIVTDNDAMCYTLTKQLIEHGHQNIGLVRGPSENTPNEERMEGYRRALAEAGLPIRDEAVAAVDPEVLDPKHEINRLVACKHRPTALVCTQDRLARAAAQELERLGYAIPGDIELGAVDDGELDDARKLMSVTARQHSYEIGKQSAAALMAHVEDPTAPPLHQRLDFEIVSASTPAATA